MGCHAPEETEFHSAIAATIVRFRIQEKGFAEYPSKNLVAFFPLLRHHWNCRECPTQPKSPFGIFLDQPGKDLDSTS